MTAEELYVQLKAAFEQSGAEWHGVQDTIASFGPRHSGANILTISDRCDLLVMAVVLGASSQRQQKRVRMCVCVCVSVCVCWCVLVCRCVCVSVWEGAVMRSMKAQQVCASQHTL